MRTALIGGRRWPLALAAAATLGVAAYAFTATNTVPATNAGSGNGTISGYTVSNVQYQLSATVPSDIDSATFTLSANATTVRAKLVSGSSTYTTCSIANGVDVTCDFSPDIDITTANQLAVIAST